MVAIMVVLLGGWGLIGCAVACGAGHVAAATFSAARRPDTVRPASGACELFRDLAGGLAEFGLPAESFMMFGAG
jgi:hypothetical protein